MNNLTPRYKWGEIAPRITTIDKAVNYQFYRVVPSDVMVVSTGLGIRDYTPELVDEAIPHFWNRVERLVAEKVDHIILAGAPISGQLGRARVLGLLREMEQKTGIPGDAPLEAAIAAMNHMGLHKIALASRWAPQLNNRITEYLEDGGLEVVGTTERGHWAAAAQAMSFEEGLQASIEVSREAAEIPGAEAILVPGGVAMTLHCIPLIEAEYGVAVLTNLNAEVWNGLVRPGIIDPVPNWGRLLAAV